MIVFFPKNLQIMKRTWQEQCTSTTHIAKLLEAYLNILHNLNPVQKPSNWFVYKLVKLKYQLIFKYKNKRKYIVSLFSDGRTSNSSYLLLNITLITAELDFEIPLIKYCTTVLDLLFDGNFFIIEFKIATRVCTLKANV